MRIPLFQSSLFFHLVAFLAVFGRAASPCSTIDISGLIDTILPTTVESSPNPIGSIYPQDPTGTLNGTIFVVPIPYAQARSVVPCQYAILNASYETLLPGLPTGQYPLVIRSSFDHDILYNGLNLVPDFTKVNVFYPFIDLLGDGYSSFAYNPTIAMTATNIIAEAGAAAYGETVYPSTFTPPNNAYVFVDGPDGGEYFFNAYTNLSACPAFTTKFKSQPTLGPWPLDFYVNVTNQPIFKDPSKNCDNYINLFNTSLSTGENAPVGVKGDIFVAAPLLPKDSQFEDVYGIKVDVAFIEKNMASCSSLKGTSR